MINQLTIIITFFLAITVFTISRKYFLLPFMVAACFIPADQRIIVLSLDFTPLRILLIVGVVRLLLRKELRTVKWNRFDKLVLLWAVVGAIIYTLQWMDFRAVIYKCGILFDILGWYWLFRVNIHSWDDVRFVFRILAICSIVTAGFVGAEWITGQNPFAILGKVTTGVREGRYRCQAAFPHSIMLGLFWATLVPTFIALAMSNQFKWFYWVASAASVFIVAATASSTPICTLVLVLLLLALFRYRRYGSLAAWGLCAITVMLHIVMRAPVWHLISRIDIVSGSTGWHRYHLIDQAINNFSEWAFLGCRSTSQWGFMLEDVTNQFVLEGVGGGLITLVLFIALLVVAIKTVGGYSLYRISLCQQWLVWGICISMLGHCIAFFGVSYFGQIRTLLFLCFAVVGWIYGLPNPVITVPKPKIRPQYVPQSNGCIGNYS
jgi:hypothetical protein